MPAEGVRTEYIEFFVRTVRDELDAYAPATAQKNINLEILGQVAVSLPPTQEQDEIFSRANQLLSTINVVETEVQKQSGNGNLLRHSVLKTAFAGQLVPQDPNDEPASELLDGISSG